jgi:hypothetical protein
MLTVLAAVTATGCSVNVGHDEDTTSLTENDVVSSAGLTRVEIDTENGSVDVVGGPDGEISVRTVLRESDKGDAGYSIDEIDDRLVVTGECDAGWRDACDVSFVVTLPAGLDVDVSTDNGRIAIGGVGGAIELATDNGAIEGDALDARTVEANTDNGRIRLNFDEPPNAVDVETDNGAIDIRLPDDENSYDVEATSDNGTVTIDVDDDPAAGRRISAESDNGSIDISYISAT